MVSSLTPRAGGDRGESGAGAVLSIHAACFSSSPVEIPGFADPHYSTNQGIFTRCSYGYGPAWNGCKLLSGGLRIHGCLFFS